MRPVSYTHLDVYKRQPVKEAVPEEKPEVPIYRETANYAYEAGELASSRASLAANVECRSAIEAAISSNYGDNRLDADAAVKSILEPVSYTHLAFHPF